ncbi:acyltransferase [Gallaecimonas kandeliae]|uniref:acyltransferase n=1 Tax=Gallaecimonas kandeliae TaxID=3029055 RepID=UPI002648D585|nr:acyltransferase [Gallaecimonas kandeliae]WKE65600.1 acyltransferase [Gallaecimonas kandeliae]
MLSFLPRFILMPLMAVLLCLNVAFGGGMVMLLSIPKLILPIPAWRRFMTTVMELCIRAWSLMNMAILRLGNKAQWQITGLEQVKKDGWYLMMANHLSWLDIIVLYGVAGGRLPLPRFFLKRELIFVPFLGLGCWAMDMPFMRRYSTAYLKKHPHKKGKDIEATAKACAKLKHHPSTMINFVEGTRSTAEKLRKRRSPYQYLLPPKAAGIAYALSAMGQQFDKVLDVTLAYPGSEGHIGRDVLSGKLRTIVVDVEALPVTDRVIGDYFNDVDFKRGFQGWLNERWQLKDRKLAALTQSEEAPAALSEQTS